MKGGIALVDKGVGVTSHDVVAKTRKALGTRKVGHAGTLDPLATGLLVIGVDSSTRLLTHMVGLDKEYRATIRLGQHSDSDDTDGVLSDPVARDTLDAVTDQQILAAIEPLRGVIQQVPSTVSAIKVSGRRAYDLVRSGEEVVLQPRKVTIQRFDVVQVRRGADTTTGLECDVVVECSSGTYIRALARDLGRALGVGGHLSALRRTRVGPFTIEQAVAIENISREALINPAEAASAVLSTVNVTAQQAADLGHGKRILNAGVSRELPASHSDSVAAIGPHGRLVAIVRAAGHDGREWRVETGFGQEDVE